MKKTIAIILVFCFMIPNGILTYAKNTDVSSTELCVGQIIEKYSIDDIRTLYMARNVKGYTEQITIKEKEEISDFLKELYNLKLTTNKDEGNIKIDLWRDAALGTVTIYSSTKGLSNQDISYYIDLQDVDKIIENMNLHWVENKASGPGYPVAGVEPKENSETLIVNNVLGEPEYSDFQYLKVEKLNNTNTKETVTCKDISKIKKFYQLFLDLPISEKKDHDSNIYIELISNDNKYIYSSDDGLSVQDKIYYVRESDVLDCLSQSDITQWYSLPVVDKNESLITPNDSNELSKTYEMGILNQNGIIVGDPDGDLREGDEITRAEFAAVLCRAMGCENETENDDLKQKNYFPDVPAEHWAAGYVNFAYENSAISGFPDGNFYPEQKVTNEQVIKMLIGAWGYGDEAEKNGGYPNGYMKVAKEHGVLDTIEFNYKNASKRWVASVFVYGVLSMPTENPKVKQPIKTELISVEQPREENDNYVEHPEEILRNVSKESSFYERTTFEQRVPTKHLPIKIDGKNITNVWFRVFSIGINIVGAKQEGFHAELAVGESVDVSDFANGEYNIIVGYNDGKVDDYSFGKIVIFDENVELAGFMHRYTNLRDVIQFDQTVTEVELSNENTLEDMPFELKATSDGKGGYVLCINYSGSLTGEQKFSYAINDIDESLNYKVDESERFTAPKTSIEPIVIHNLQSGTEYCLQVEFNDKHIEKSIKGTLTVDNNDFLFKGNWQIATMK